MFRLTFVGIPVLVEGWFWVSCLLMGGGLSARSPEAWTIVAIFTIVAFISILIHEAGHALAGRHFGADPAIKLHAFGGVTFLPGGRFSRTQSILVTAAGPAAGLVLGLIFWLLYQQFAHTHPVLRVTFAIGQHVNFFWTFLNLLPIQPLDGGQILREALGPRRSRITSWVGVVTAALTCWWSVASGQIFLALMMGMLAYYNFREEPVEGGVIKG